MSHKVNVNEIKKHYPCAPADKAAPSWARRPLRVARVGLPFIAAAVRIIPRFDNSPFTAKPIPIVPNPDKTTKAVPSPAMSAFPCVVPSDINA